MAPRSLLERLLAPCLLFGLVLGLAACGATAHRLPADVAWVAPTEYRIGPGDVLEIAVWNDPAVSRKVPVRPDGLISLPLVDDVPAAGLTPMELREALAVRLRRFLPDPAVSVLVQEVHSTKFSVMGEVEAPGRFELICPTTLLDAIAMAKGFTVWASSAELFLIRPEAGRAKRYRIERDTLVDDASNQNILLRPGDIVMVP
ncbi:MAG: polysaccharide biosynthesis/export family protein [Myxococcales bacterium]|nr:polysaccharide biosynthesis/export family protein [Myxococcales bacterium]